MATARTFPILAAGLVLAGILAPAPIHAQFGVLRNLGHTPQAKTQEEFDLFLEIVAASAPRNRVVRVSQFVDKFPTSELLGQAYQYEMVAYRDLDDLDGVVRSGEIALPLLPGNIETLLTIASAIPNATAGRENETDLLMKAEQYAREALEVIGSKQIPRQIAYSDWRVFRSQLEAQAHEALGHIAAKRGKLDVAVAEFDLATRINQVPDGRQHFRLGSAHLAAGNRELARQALSTAVDLGPDEIRALARKELEHLRGSSK